MGGHLTAVGAATTAPEHLRAELERGVREELLRIVSHDLRGSIGAIMTSVAMIERLEAAPPVAERLRRYAAVIHRSSQRLDRYLGDLVELARLDAGGVVLARDEVPADALAADARDVARSLAGDRPLAVDVAIDAPGAVVRGDRARIARVLANLVANAVHVTPGGGRITIGARGDGAFVELRVGDTGPGVPDALRARLLGPYWQARSAGLAAGLGLPVARAIVEAHGGRLWFESHAGAGTTFYFTVPAAR